MKVVSLESTVKTWFSKYYRNILCSDIPENLDITEIDHAEFKYEFILVIQTPYGAREPNYGNGGQKFFLLRFRWKFVSRPIRPRWFQIWS